MGYLSRRARISDGVLLGPDVKVYGESRIGSGSKIYGPAIIGYPSRASLLGAGASDEELDRASSGAVLGNGVVIRPFTVVYEGAELGDHVETGHHVIVREGVRVGAGTLIGSGTILDGPIVIGRNVSIQSSVYLPKGSIVEDNVFLAPRVCVTNDKYPASKRLAGVTIRRGAVIGANATLIAGIEIGEYAVVAAGAVVTKDVPPRSVVMGIPARIAGTREDYEAKKRAYEEAPS